ncbi:helix-turn-helix domain-containing protein [Streptomyces sp. NPDC005752]|uniref:helix-turn-helix domain-containing protein n=1 Tax=Streptomyces sp. NPDC005752 TaxID=3157065 RepID=UPI0033E18199
MSLWIDAGRPIAHVAAEAGISRHRLAEWYALWLAHGENGLRHTANYSPAPSRSTAATAFPQSRPNARPAASTRTASADRAGSEFGAPSKRAVQGSSRTGPSLRSYRPCIESPARWCESISTNLAVSALK